MPLIRRPYGAGQADCEAHFQQAYWGEELKVNNLAFNKIHLPFHISDYRQYTGSPTNPRTIFLELPFSENIHQHHWAWNKAIYEKEMVCWDKQKLNVW